MRTNPKLMQNQMASKFPFLCLILFLLGVSATISQAQDGAPSRGFRPGNAYALGNIETINVSNGNVLFNLPLAALPPGRGGLSGGLNLLYNSKLYSSSRVLIVDPHSDPDAPTFLNCNFLGVDSGWQYGGGFGLMVYSRMDEFSTINVDPQYDPTPQCPSNAARYIHKAKMIFPDGSLHEFRPVGFLDQLQDGYYEIRPDGLSDSSCATGSSGTITYYSTDGTYLRLDVAHDSDQLWWNNPWTLSFPDGRRVTFNESSNGLQRIYDRNGNYFEIKFIANYNSTGNEATQFVDQFNRTVTIEYIPSSSEDLIHFQGFGTALTTTVTWRTVTVNKQYVTTADGDNDGNWPWVESISQGLWVVDEIILPTQASSLTYTFDYNPGTSNPSYGWGELSSVTLPSGAEATYTYGSDGANYSPGSGPFWDDLLRDTGTVTEKELNYSTQYDGSSGSVTETWQYNVTAGSSTVITNPDGGVVTYYFGPFFSRSVTGEDLAYKTQTPDGKVVERIWNENLPDVSSALVNCPAINPYVKTEFTSVKDSGGTLVKTAIKDFNYDKNGNVTEVREYDWVAYSSVSRDSYGRPTSIPSGASLKRVTINTYYSPTPDASSTTSDSDTYHKSTSPQLRNAVESIEVRSGTSQSSALSRTEFYYDSSTTTGNPTEKRSWDSTKGSITRPLTTGTSGNSISITNSYLSNGNLDWVKDAKNIKTQLTYDTNNIYITRTETAYNTSVQRRIDREYDFNTGLVTSVTDYDNSVETETTYDALGRPTIVKEAVGTSNERWTRTEYDDDDRRVVVRSDLSAANDQKLVTVKHYDQLGRIRLIRKLESSSDSVTDETIGIKVQTRYFAGDADGNPSYPNSYKLVSNPYRATSSSGASSEPTMGWTRTKLDQGEREIEVQTFGGTSKPAPWGSSTNSTGTVTTAYNAEFATVTDQTNKAQRTRMDGLGRMVRVDEPDKDSGSLGDPSSPVQATDYTYDVLNNLVEVSQGSQTRTFVYSSLSRLTSATNPESGTVSYQYDNNGNLTSKTDARPVTTTLTYDDLNRVVSKSHSTTSSNSYVTAVISASPTLNYYYDSQTLPSGAPSYTRTYPKGKLAAVTYGGGSVGSYFKYDALGNIIEKYQRISTTNYQIQASYNKAGAITSGTYPSGHTVSYSYYDQSPQAAGSQKPVGTLAKFEGTLGGGSTRTYAEEILYNPAGMRIKEKYLTTTALYHNLHYNSRMQLVDIRLGTSSTDEWTWNRGALILYYGDSARSAGNQLLDASDNNGNVSLAQHWVPGNDSITSWTLPLHDVYEYDKLNRIKSAGGYQASSSSSTTQLYSQQFEYDRYGNRQIVTSSWGPINLVRFTVDDDTNQLGPPSGLSCAMDYDAAGNLKNDTCSGAGIRTYNSENKMVTADGASNDGSYVYDGEGHRVKRIVGTAETWQVYGIEGELIAEYPSGQPTTVSKEYGYQNGELLVVWEGNEPDGRTLQWLVADQLGTPRMVADSSGRLLDDSTTATVREGIIRHDYLPFGEELFVVSGGARTTNMGYPSQPAQDHVRQKFTEKERDDETGLDYFGARYYGSILGRFTSVDPENLQARLTPSDPQSWNGYSYVNNNPLRRVDKDGTSSQEILEKIANKAKYGLYVTNKELDAIVGKARYELWRLAVMEVISLTPAEVDALDIQGVLDAIKAVRALLASPGSVKVDERLDPPGIETDIFGATYRKDYNAFRKKQGKPELPSEYDAHHRIPQAFKDHPEFRNFKFDDPSNIRGVPGNRAPVNIHQQITNAWETFRRLNPNATRRQIENFARRIDAEYGKHYFK